MHKNQKFGSGEKVITGAKIDSTRCILVLTALTYADAATCPWCAVICWWARMKNRGRKFIDQWQVTVILSEDGTCVSLRGLRDLARLGHIAVATELQHVISEPVSQMAAVLYGVWKTVIESKLQRKHISLNLSGSKASLFYLSPLMQMCEMSHLFAGKCTNWRIIQ